MRYEEAVRYIGALRRFGMKPGLDRMRRILSKLDHPEDGLCFYHVAGTNGKGSVCAMLAAMLTALGHRTGLYTSPGLGGFNGRIAIDGKPILEEEFAEHVDAVRRAADASDPPTEFEVLTAVALLAFRANGVERVVWETGLGGRLDATNVVWPHVTAITNVSYDHVEILGPTLVDIAREKAGIVKPGVPVVTACTDGAYRVIERTATRLGSNLFHVGREVQFTITGADARLRGTYRGLFRDAPSVRLGLVGEHQAQNAAVSLAMLELGEGQIAEADWARALAALERVRWPLRCELFDIGGRLVVIDGAHNEEGARTLARALRRLGKGMGSSRWRMVFAAFADKDVQSMLAHMLPLARAALMVKSPHPRGADPRALAALVREMRPDLSVCVMSSIEDAIQEALAGQEPIVIWGNLYMAELARNTIIALGAEEWQ
ncbi:bifunctional folylpolyglutamate synthase/dihydrofolate synthase [Alicyclobacillus acidocaldarius]|uniref:tetrahydrofolate synthase n=1 Tax=Alicyclobacillus acidocaldarius (strain Tc-4-1) TaxID=1048834 RepID=F8IDI8_ALIAT|nr:folylpolyglutamate synthase/dihydrofolate synthase family protein [Alicyclobacillus acidocaldarius]AEJ43841.1 FolC bifunctional protein [Alicyclobacillus acidocaldarius subsp. acidocaldarius Tc-4-1]